MNTNLQIVTLPIDSLTPYEKNSRKHKDIDVAVIKKSIEEFGMCDPIGIWGPKNIIVEGHGRLMALKELGYKEVPCIRLDHLSDEQRKAYGLTHNRSAELSSWDFDVLLEELEGLQDEFNLDDLGFNEFLSNEEPFTPSEDNFNEEDYLEEEPTSQKGDIYVLGKHRLMCGDSILKADVDLLMNGQLADMVFVDPPYGVSAAGGRSQTKDMLGMKEIENDNLRKEELTSFLSEAIKNMPFKDDASLYICYSWQSQKEFTNAILNNDLKIKNCIIWDKKVFGLNGFKGYRPQYEMIYFCCREEFIWYGDKGQSNVWPIEREINREEQGNHPTPKPIELITKALVNSSKEEDIVLDSFGGCGSTLIACEQLNRKCYMMEIEPCYIDVVVKRYLHYVGSDKDCYLIRNGEKLSLPQNFLDATRISNI